MSLISRLIRIAREKVQDIQRRVLQQISILEDEVQAQLQNYVSEVMDGVWRGRGADEFVRSITEEALPKLGEITGNLTDYNSRIEHALSIMDDADSRSRAAINRLANTFERI